MKEIDNEKVVRDFFEAASLHSLESIKKCLDEDCIIIYPDFSVHDREEYLNEIPHEFSAFPDSKMDIEFMLSKNEKVMVECHWSGTLVGNFHERQATNCTYVSSGVIIFKVERGKISLIKYYWNPTLF